MWMSWLCPRLATIVQRGEVFQALAQRAYHRYQEDDHGPPVLPFYALPREHVWLDHRASDQREE